MVSFNQIPSNLRIPFAAVEFDSSKAQQGPALLVYNAVLIGQKLAGGTGVANTLVRVTNVDQVIVLAGRGSMLHRGAIAWFANNKVTPLWIGILADDGAGVAAQGTITVTVTTALAGTIALYLGGERITVGVNANDAQNTIATNIAAAITAAADLPITAAAVANVVTWTYRHKGLVGNSYDVRHGFRDGESLPAGVALAIAATTAGTTNPSLTNLIAAMSDLWFHVWAHPYTDATSLTVIETELADRFGPMRMMDGVAFTAATGTFGALSALGTGRNSKHSSIQSQPGVNPIMPPMEFAAETAAQIAMAAAADPARPVQTIQLARAIAPTETDSFDNSERNLLLFAGISTTKRTPGGGVALERPITTYRTSPAGADDPSYLDVTTMFTLMYLRYSFRQRMISRYPRHKLANDGTRFGAGQAVMTPKLAKAEALAWFREMEQLGLVENYDQFRRDLGCERSSTDPNRLEFVLPTDLVNFLCVTAAQVQFRL